MTEACRLLMLVKKPLPLARKALNPKHGTASRREA